ncbi:MAG TPA: radical SAM protein [Thiobacillaceae bacterium]|nr:radical SAM protein [Thiobacillaceae bacterium]
MDRFGVRNLALIPSWECDIACHHCVFNSSPRTKGRLDLVQALQFIDELIGCSSIEIVTISGGEVFVDHDYVLAVAQHCAKRPVNFRIVTNASFAVSDEAATAQLLPLCDAGLHSICVSWDRFHETFISAERVKTAIRTCRRLGITVEMTCVVSRESRIEDALAALEEEGYELRVVQVKALPIGRGAKKLKPESLFPASYWERGRACRSDFDTIAIVRDGTVYPCCAVGGFTDAIALGRYPNESAAGLLARRRDSFKWSMLAARGPTQLMSCASAEELAAVGADPASHDCVNCHRLFSSGLGATLVDRAKSEVDETAMRLMKLSGVA